MAVAQLALATLELGVSRYADALAVLRPLVDAERPGWTGQALPLTVEAAARTGERALAERCAHELHRRATAAGAAWGLGLSARSHALIAPDHVAEAFYDKAISQLERTSVAVDLAHCHLLYGEWLRRQSRRRAGLIEAYKTGITTKHSLNDLYVRFFRVAERKVVDGHGHGVVCLITNFSYLHEPGFAQMRASLLANFDQISIDCLNGDSRETGKRTPEGKPDPSIFASSFKPQGIQVGTGRELTAPLTESVRARQGSTNANDDSARSTTSS